MKHSTKSVPPVDHAKQGGFTLIEILIVVAIMGVLAAIALPAYQNSVLRGGRAEGKGELMIVASYQERFFSSNNTYSTDATPLVTEVPANLTVRTTENGLYTIAVAAGATGDIATSFVATATPQGQQTGDACTTLTISSTGLRGATGDTADECWGR